MRDLAPFFPVLNDGLDGCQGRQRIIDGDQVAQMVATAVTGAIDIERHRLIGPDLELMVFERGL